MRRIRTVAIFPTLLTLANLICGFFALVVASRIDAPTESSDKTPITAEINIHQIPRVPWIVDRKDPTQNIVLCGWLIVLGMLFDTLDGRVARLANQTSDFGAQLDSLSDLVTFGAAPAFLMVKMCPSFSYEHRNWVWIIATIFVSCAALRLARFNVETTEEDDHGWFSGLPTPAAAAAIAGFALVFYTLRSSGSDSERMFIVDELVQWVLPDVCRLCFAAHGIPDSLPPFGQPTGSWSEKLRTSGSFDFWTSSCSSISRICHSCSGGHIRTGPPRVLSLATFFPTPGQRRADFLVDSSIERDMSCLPDSSRP